VSPQPCPECKRLWEDYNEIIQKTFRLKERLSQAKLVQDFYQAQALSARLVALEDSQTRLSQALTEHISQAHSAR
jgi:hypothetical protein